MQTIQPAKKSSFAGCYSMKGICLSPTFFAGTPLFFQKKEAFQFSKVFSLEIAGSHVNDFYCFSVGYVVGSGG